MGIILVRYNEIYLKGKNRHIFEKLLKDNIAKSLEGFNLNIRKIPTRILIENYLPHLETRIIGRLKQVLGVYSLSVASVVPADIEEIKKATLKAVTTTKTFRITARRADKSFPLNSQEVARLLGGYVLENNHNVSVNLFDFDQEINIEIREDKSAYIYSESVRCCGGLPVGCSGKGLLLLSGGIDSPVAGYMMAKRGMSIAALHFHSFPYTSEMAKQKVVDLARILKEYTLSVPLYVIPFTEIQTAIHENCVSELMIILMRRFMMRIANEVARISGAQAILTGENLAQVASQTVESITVTNVIAKYPVFRPLIGFDKIDIIEIAERIGTYETSILPHEDCCTVFLPKKPVIKPKLERIEKAESKLNVDELVERAVKGIELIRI